MRSFGNFMEGMISGEYRDEQYLHEILEKFEDKEEIVRFGIYCARDVEYLIQSSFVGMMSYTYACKAGQLSNKNGTETNKNKIINNSREAAYYAAMAKAYNEGLNDPTDNEMFNLYKKHYADYVEIARRWLIRIENPSNDLVGLSRSNDFDHLIYDMLQDDDDLRDTLIPWNGVRYYLNIHGYTDKIFGTSQNSVIEKIVNSSDKERISNLIKRMIR